MMKLFSTLLVGAALFTTTPALAAKNVMGFQIVFTITPGLVKIDKKVDTKVDQKDGKKDAKSGQDKSKPKCKKNPNRPRCKKS